MSARKRCDMCGKIQDANATYGTWATLQTQQTEKWKDLCDMCATEVVAFVERRSRELGA